MNFDDLIAQLARVAETAARVVPHAQAGAEIGRKVLELIDGVGRMVSNEAPQANADDLARARHTLRTAVSQKAQETANRLEGRQ